jgi:ribosomal protein S18 acetylase RimI-like enzyme
MNLGINGLPEGYVSRPATLEDLEGVVEAINASERKFTGSTMFTVGEYRLDWDLPAFCLETDTRVVLSPQGEVAGVLEYWDVNQPHVRYDLWGRVHPEHEGYGIGSHLLAWAEARAQRSAQAAQPGTRLVLRSFIRSVNAEAGQLFTDHGYCMLRHGLRMVIDLDGEPPAPQWPEGIRVRSLQPGEETAVVHAERDSLKDHFGYVEAPFEQDYERWMHMIRNDEHFDPSLWFLALSNEEIAGISLCRSSWYDDPDLGWVNTLGVLRPWRRRGLGLALLQHSFVELHRRGKPRVGLGVDAESLTGATRLYLKAGMRPDPRHQFSLYEKELRAGVDLSTRSLQE